MRSTKRWPDSLVAAAAGLAPADRMADRPLGGVVGRLDSRDSGKRPQRRLHREDFSARRGGFGARGGRAARQQRADFVAELGPVELLEGGASQRRVAELRPQIEQQARLKKQLLADELRARTWSGTQS